MTVLNENAISNHAGNNSATTFDFDFLINAEDELTALRTADDGTQTTLTLNTDYSINETGNESGSYITFPLVGSSYGLLQSDENISIYPNLSFTQETAYKNSTALNLENIENSFDYQCRLAQQLKVETDRAVKVPYASSITADDLLEAYQDAAAEITSGFASLTAVDAKVDNLKIVNVLDYGATGNGTTDDTTAVESALAVSPYIYFPEGTYIIGNIRDNTNYSSTTGHGTSKKWQFIGDGRHRTILKCPATQTNGYIFWLGSPDNDRRYQIDIRGIQFDGVDKDSGNKALLLQNVVICDTSDLLFRNMDTCVEYSGIAIDFKGKIEIYTSKYGFINVVTTKQLSPIPDADDFDLSTGSLRFKGNVNTFDKIWATGVTKQVLKIKGGGVKIDTVILQSCGDSLTESLIYLDHANESLDCGNGPVINNLWAEGGTYKSCIEAYYTRGLKINGGLIYGNEEDTELAVLLTHSPNANINGLALGGTFTAPPTEGRTYVRTFNDGSNQLSNWIFTGASSTNTTQVIRLGHYQHCIYPTLTDSAGTRTVKCYKKATAASITSITSVGTTATVTQTAHGYSNGNAIEITGANQAEYNGIVTITVTGDDTYTYTITGSPASPATGTILGRELKCYGSLVGDGTITLASAGNSTLSGTVDVAYTTNDTNIILDLRALFRRGVYIDASSTRCKIDMYIAENLNGWFAETPQSHEITKRETSTGAYMYKDFGYWTMTDTYIGANPDVSSAYNLSIDGTGATSFGFVGGATGTYANVTVVKGIVTTGT